MIPDDDYPHPLGLHVTKNREREAGASLAAPAGSERVMHVCCVCSHRWVSADAETERHVITAAKVNKDGPYCGMCMHLEMAERYALARGFEAIEGGVKKWRVLRSQKQAPNE